MASRPQEAYMTTPPDFGGREIEEGLFEDLGGTREEYLQEHAQEHVDEGGLVVDDNEAHAPGMVCGLCGAVIAGGQDVRRRADGTWVHESCPLV
jgi:hypothetical protein